MVFSKSRRDSLEDGGVAAVPPNLQYDSVEITDEKRQQWQRIDTAGELTPYLGLRARLSQIWINRWTVLLLLVLVRVLLLLASLNDNIGDAKVKALAACSKVEDIGSAVASMPHYLSVGVNHLVADGITKVVHGMVEILTMILTGVEALILFVINLYLGTYTCLITALIHGALDIGIGAADEVTDVMNKGIQGGVDDLNKAASGFQKAIDDAFNVINGAAGVFGKKVDPPKLDFTDTINNLKGIKVDDTSFVQDLVSINKTIPTFDQVENFTKNAIAEPFDLVKNLLNTSYGGYAFDNSIFPVANKEALTFCSNNSIIVDFFQSLYSIAATAKIAFIVSLVVLAVLVCIPMTWLEIRKYRRQVRRAREFTQRGYDAMDIVYISSRPLTAGAGFWIASKFKSPKRQVLARWAIAYGTSLPAIFVLSLALAGFFSALCQFILLRAIQKEAPALEAQVGNFAGEVVSTLEDVSFKWARDANGVILHLQDGINKDVLGYVTNATSAVNNTLNVFETQVNDALMTIFNGTVLKNTVLNVVYCLVGMKIDNVEKGLTWVHDHAQVTLPLFPNDTFSLGAQASITNDTALTSFLASPSSVTTDEVSGAVDHVVNMLYNNMIQDVLIATGLLCVYVIVVLLGIIRSMAGMSVPTKHRGDGGQNFVDPRAAADLSHSTGASKLTGDNRAPLSPRSQARQGDFGHNESSSSRWAKGNGNFEGDDMDADHNSLEGVRDEKRGKMEALNPAHVRGGKARALPGHVRQSSHGQVGVFDPNAKF